MVRNACALLMCSRGIPMFLAGDEFCNTQFGNNNAYCQDNEISWLDWGRLGKYKDIFRFFQYMIRFRKTHRLVRANVSGGACGFPGCELSRSKALVQLLCGVRAICGRHVCGPGGGKKALRPCTLRPMHIGRSLMWSCLYFRTEWNGSWRQTPGRIRLVRVPWGQTDSGFVPEPWWCWWENRAVSKGKFQFLTKS